MRTVAAQPDLLEALATDGCVVLPGWLEPESVAALRAELPSGGSLEGLQRAGVGRGGERRVVDAIRGDWIRWLDGSSPEQEYFLQRMEAIRLDVNRGLQLGVFEVEAHFALYPPGSGYERHLDAFQSDNPRRLSAVLYLNHDWAARDGGELAIYDAMGCEIRRVLPEGGTLVLFLSQQVPHAVLPATRWRASIATWFRVRGRDSALP
jgi:SM-20-related protein